MKRIALIIVIIVTLFISRVNALNKSVIDIEDLTLEKTIEYLDKGVITSEELVNLYLDRINTYNSEYNALITLNDKIVEEARNSDNLRKSNQKRGILEGVPIIVKDNIDVYGMPTTGGAKTLSDNYPIEDSDVIKKLKEEGAIVIAKANMSEFAFSAKDSYSSYGYVYNAYKKGYTSYGSSGGSAVSVALNFGVFALGTDTNSSVRLPASAAGLVGLRPTYNLLSSKGVIPYDITRDTVGILTKTVQDNKIVFNILNSEYKDYDNKEIVIGVPNSFYIGDEKASIKANKLTYEPIKDSMKELIDKLDSNISIVYLDDFYTSKIQYYNTTSISGFTMCDGFNEYLKGTTGKIRSFKQLYKSNGKTQSLKDYVSSCNYNIKTYNRSISYQNKMREYINEVFDTNKLDYIMYPSTKNAIYLKGENSKLLNVSSTISSTTGYPALTIPLTYVDNLPYGIEILSKANEENKLYYLASIIEKENDLVNKYDTEVKPLYEIDEDTKELVNIYLNNYGQDKELDNEIKEYFRNYNSLNETNSKDYITKYDRKEEIIDDDTTKNAVGVEDDNTYRLILLLSIIAVVIVVYARKSN